MTRRCVVFVGLLIAAIAGHPSAQGVQTGAIRGAVKDEQDLPISGVTITAASPALQAPRQAVTDAHGFYTVSALPAGLYEVTYALSGFSTVTRTTAVPLGLTIEQNVSMLPAGIAETVHVAGEPGTRIGTAVVGANFRKAEIDALATPRTIQGIAQLAPAVTENSPNAGQIVINGAFAFDNVFMVNGVDINDNLFAQPQNLFIEDAIEETQVLTSGISAEYGRFTGGVINAITKSGGNTFSGSVRINFFNPAWTTPTPFEVSRGVAAAAHPSMLSAMDEGTVGGPIVRDRLWFFTAGRYASVDATTTLPQTGISLPTRDANARGEIKLTGTVFRNHTIQGGYLADPRTRTNNSGLQAFVITPDSEVDRRNPNDYSFTNYRGVVRNALLAEAQYSQRHFKFENDGGTATDIRRSPIVSATECACVYNAPYFDATDPEERNNRQITGSVIGSWNLSGRHDTKGGYEWFQSQRTGGNSQSSTSYVFNADFATDASGRPVIEDGRHLVPVFVPGVSSVSFFPAVKGAVMNTDTNAAYVQDRWTLNSRWSLDLGARYEHVRARSTGDIVSVNGGRIVPRLAAAYDLSGGGARIVHVTYGWYSGRYNEAQIGANSPVGHPAELDRAYVGPPGAGVNFAPGFDLANYPIDPETSAALVPTANIFTDPNLRSPVVKEFTASYGTNLGGGRGSAQGTWVHRDTTDLIEDFQTIQGGFTRVVLQGVDAGTFTNVIYRNVGTDVAARRYDALEFQSQYRVNDGWSVNGHYTLMLRSTGNYEGELANQPGKTSFIGNYPEAFSAARNFPTGTLQDFERSRLRVWSLYDWNMGRKGSLSLSGLWRVDSALSYSLRAVSPPLTATQRILIAAAGYPDAPNTTSSGSGYFVYFGDRGSGRFAGYGLFDASMNYDVPVFRSFRPWVKLDVYNVLNNQKLVAWDVTVGPDTNGPKDALGLPLNYVRSPTFGTATGNTINLTGLVANAYPSAFTGAPAGGRARRVSVGVRF